MSTPLPPLDPDAPVLLADWQLADPPARSLAFIRQKEGIALAVVDGAGAIRLFDARRGGPWRGEELLAPLADAGPVYDISVLPQRSDFAHLVAVGADGAVRVYDLSRREHVRAVQTSGAGPMNVVESLQAPDGSPMIAVGGADEAVHLWRGHQATPLTLPGHHPPVRAMRALRATHHLAVADDEGITIWDLRGDRPARRSCGRGRCRSLIVLPGRAGGLLLAAAMADGIHLRDPQTGRDVTHVAQGRDITAVAALRVEDGEQILAAGDDDGITIWNLSTDRQLLRLGQDHLGRVRVIRRILTSEGSLLAAADDNGYVGVWLLARPSRWVLNQIGRHDDWVCHLAVLEDPPQPLLLASASDDHRVILWRLPDATRKVEIDHGERVHTVVTTGGDIFTGDEGGLVRRWEVGADAARLHWRHDYGIGPVRSMASCYSGSDRLVVAGGASGRCALVDARSGEMLHELRTPDSETAPGQPIRALTAARLAGTWLIAAGDAAGSITVWDAETGQRRWSRSQGAQVRRLASLELPAGLRLVSGGDDGAIRWWDPATGERVDAWPDAHTGPVSALHPVERGSLRLLASGGADGKIRIWRPNDHQPIGQLPGAHEGWVRALVQIPSDRRILLASAGEEGAIRLWEYADDHLHAYPAYHPVTRGFRDRPSEVDLLDRESLRHHLCALLGPAGEAGHGTTDGPQGVTIQGPWGTGKTTLMRQVQHQLEARSAQRDPVPTDRRRRGSRRELTPHQVSRLTRIGATSSRHRADQRPRPIVSRTVTAWFNPWAHESSEQIWAGLATAIVDATRDRLGDTKAERQRYWLIRNLPRLDGAAVRRTIRSRLGRPTAAAVALLALPLFAALVRGDALSLAPIGKNLPIWLLGALVVAIMLLGAHALWMFYFGRISAYLPVEIFDGPVHLQSLHAAGERLSRDLPYVSSGQLYHSNEDVRRIALDLETRGYQLVVFIDDLDRTSRRSIASVFEAVNSFLVSDAAPRFVIGLDATVVATRLAEVHATGDPVSTRPDPEDPHPGWSVLRKLSQLTVVMPATLGKHASRLLPHDVRPPHAVHDATVPVAVPPPPTGPPGPGRPGAVGAARPTSPTAAPAGPARPPDVPVLPATRPDALSLRALEADPLVQRHLSRLVELRPRQSMREHKRLLTQWTFYVRLLRDLLPGEALTDACWACDAMTLAEIVVRWPALVPALSRDGDRRSGLSELVDAVTEDAESNDMWQRAWHGALQRVGLDRPEYATADANLFALLVAHGNPQVAEFADRLL